MEIKKIDGRTYAVFSAHEVEAQRQFECSMTSEDTLEKMVEALLKANATLEQDRRAGWNQLTGKVVEVLNLKSRDDLPAVLSYSWIYGGIEVPEDLIPSTEPE